MKKIDFENKITMYINGELDQQDKINFEKAMDENSNYKNLLDDIIHNDDLLKKLPHINVSRNFMFNLNSRIDQYNKEGNRTWYSIIKEYTFNIKPAPALSIACVALVTCFSIIKISGYDFSNFLNSKHKHNIDFNNYIAVNDSDSLSSAIDSLDLLIGNDR